MQIGIARASLKLFIKIFIKYILTVWIGGHNNYRSNPQNYLKLTVQRLMEMEKISSQNTHLAGFVLWSLCMSFDNIYPVPHKTFCPLIFNNPSRPICAAQICICMYGYTYMYICISWYTKKITVSLCSYTASFHPFSQMISEPWEEDTWCVCSTWGWDFFNLLFSTLWSVEDLYVDHYSK